MVDLKIGIDISNISSSSKTIKRSYDDIKKASNEIVKSTELLERGFKKLSSSTKPANDLTKAFQVLNSGVGKLKRGIIDATTFQLRYGKAISQVKKDLRDSFGEHKRSEIAIKRVNTAIKNNVVSTKNIIKEQKKATAAQLKYNRSIVSNELKRGATALKLIEKNTLEAAKAQQKYNRSVTSNELKRGAIALKAVNKETKDLKAAQDKLNRSITKNAFKKGARDLKAMRKEQKKFNDEVKDSKGAIGIMTIALGNLAAKGLALVAAQLSQAPRLLKQYSDAWLEVTNKIKVAVDTQEELFKVRERLFTIAQETRVDLKSQTTLYNRLTIAQKELGATQDEIIDVIRGVGHALGVTSTSALESRGSLIQLAQAFGQSIVRAEEFNSIMEGTPRIAKAVADGFGLTRSQLRGLVLDGKVTSKAFFEAFKSQLPLLEKEFGLVSVTIEQSLTLMRNSFVLLIGQFNELTGAAPAVAKAFTLVAKGVAVAGSAIGALAEAVRPRTLLELLEETRQKINEIENAETISEENRVSRHKKRLERNSERIEADKRRVDALVAGQKRSLGDVTLIDKDTSLQAREEEELSKLRKKAAILASDVAVAQRSKDFKDFQKDQEERRKATVAAEKKKFAILEAAFKSNGTLSDELFNHKLKLIEDEKKANIKANISEVQAEQIAWDKIVKIIEKGHKAEFTEAKRLSKEKDKLRKEELKRLDDGHKILEDINKAEIKLAIKKAKEITNTEIENQGLREKGRIRAEEAQTAALGRELKKQEKARLKSIKKQQDEYDKFLKDIEKETASVFKDIFSGELDSFEDFTDRMFKLFTDMLADMAARAIAQPIIVPLVQSVVGGAAGLFGLAGAPTAPGGLGITDALSLGRGFLGGGFANPLLSGPLNTLGANIFGATAFGGAAAGNLAAAQGIGFAGQIGAGTAAGSGGIAAGITSALPAIGLIAAVALPLIMDLFKDDPDPRVGLFAGTTGGGALASSEDFFFHAAGQDEGGTAISQPLVDFFDERFKILNEFTGSLDTILAENTGQNGQLAWLDPTAFDDTGDLFRAIEQSVFDHLKDALVEGLTTAVFDDSFFKKISLESELPFDTFARFAKVVQETDNFTERFTNQVENLGLTSVRAFQNLEVIFNIFDVFEKSFKSITDTPLQTNLDLLTEQWEELTKVLENANATTNELIRAEEVRNVTLGAQISGLTASTLQGILVGTQNIEDQIQKSISNLLASSVAESLTEQFILPLNRAIGAAIANGADAEELASILQGFDITPLSEAVNDFKDSLDIDPTTARKNYVDALKSEIDTLQEAQDQIQETYDDAKDAYVSALQEQIDIYSDLTTALSDFRREILSTTGTPTQQFGAARGAFEAGVQGLFSGDPEVVQSSLANLPDLSSEFLSASKLVNADFGDYTRDVNRVLVALSTAEGIGGVRLSEAEQQLAGIEDIAESNKSLEELSLAYFTAKEALDNSSFQSQIDYYTEELDVLNQINTNIISLAEARAGFIQSGGTAPGPVLSSAPGTTGASIWLGAFDPFNPAGLPGFDHGGIFNGPLSGSPVNLHGREAVIPMQGNDIPVRIESNDNKVLDRVVQLLETLVGSGGISNRDQAEMLDIARRVTRNNAHVFTKEVA